VRPSVICISRTAAAGGETIGRQVAEKFDYRYVDEEVLARASEMAKVDPLQMAQAEQRQSLLSRFLEALGSQPVESYLAVPPEAGAYYASGTRPTIAPLREDLRHFIREAIVEIAEKRKVVIVAHAASIALAGREGVLRVLVTASPRTRVQRLWLGGGLLSEGDAESAVKESDRERLDYLKRFYGVREESPTLYDIVLNTDTLRPDQAVAAIVGAAGT
jgi:cytidylate kinase